MPAPRPPSTPPPAPYSARGTPASTPSRSPHTHVGPVRPDAAARPHTNPSADLAPGPNPGTAQPRRRGFPCRIRRTSGSNQTLGSIPPLPAQASSRRESQEEGSVRSLPPDQFHPRISPTASLISFPTGRSAADSLGTDMGAPRASSPIPSKAHGPHSSPGRRAERLNDPPALNFDPDSDPALGTHHPDDSASSDPHRRSPRHHIFPLLRQGGGSVRDRTRQRVKSTLSSHRTSFTPSAHDPDQRGRQPSADALEEQLITTPITTVLTGSSSGSSLPNLPLPGGAASAPTVHERPNTTVAEGRSGSSKSKKFHISRLFGKHGKHRDHVEASGSASVRDEGASSPLLPELHQTRSTPSLKGNKRRGKSGASRAHMADFTAAPGMPVSRGIDAELEDVEQKRDARPPAPSHTPSTTSAPQLAETSTLSSQTVCQPNKTQLMPTGQPAQESVDFGRWSWDKPSDQQEPSKMEVTPSTTTLTPEQPIEAMPSRHPSVTSAASVGPAAQGDDKPIPGSVMSGSLAMAKSSPAALSAVSPGADLAGEEQQPSPPPDLSKLPAKTMFGATRWRSNSDSRPSGSYRPGTSPLSNFLQSDDPQRSPGQSPQSKPRVSPRSSTAHIESAKIPGLYLPFGNSDVVYTASPTTASGSAGSAAPWSRDASIAPALAPAPAPGISPGAPEFPALNNSLSMSDPSAATSMGSALTTEGPSPSSGRALSNWSAPESWAVESAGKPPVSGGSLRSGSTGKVIGQSDWMAPPSWAVHSGDTTAKGASSWMAPDSWAVQTAQGAQEGRDPADSDEEDSPRARGSSDPNVGASSRPAESMDAPGEQHASTTRPRRSGSSGRDTLTSLPLRQVRPQAGRSRSHDRLPRENSVGGQDAQSPSMGQIHGGQSKTPTPPISRSSTPTSLFLPSNESASTHRPSNATSTATGQTARSDLDSIDSVEEMLDLRTGGPRGWGRSESPAPHQSGDSSFSLFRRKEDPGDSTGRSSGPVDPRADPSSSHKHHHKGKLPPRGTSARGGGGALAAASGAVGTAASILGLRTGSPRVPGLSRYHHHHGHHNRDRAAAEASTSAAPAPSVATGVPGANPPTPSPRQMVPRPLLPVVPGNGNGATLHALANMGLGSSIGLAGMSEYNFNAGSPASSHAVLVNSANGHDGASIISQHSTGGIATPTPAAPDEEDLLYLYRHVVQTKEPVRRLGRSSASGPSTSDAASGSSRLANLNLVRIYRPDGSFATLRLTLQSTTTECVAIIARKVSFMSATTSAYRLFVRDKGAERPLGPNEKPALIQRRRLIQAGYEESDGLEDMGKEDLSYFIKFIYRPDFVPTFDSDSFGNDKARYAHLDLHGRNLEMVPIFLYKHADWIVYLDLSGNPMYDVPADFVQMCTHLRHLRLANLALKRIPAGVRSSGSLTHLDLSSNRILQLEPSLEGCTALTSLKALNNRLYQLPPCMPRVETLRSLNLSNNRFDAFPLVLTELRNLAELDLSFNNIHSFPPEIGQLQQLQELILVGNSLAALPEEMAGLGKLHTVDLRRNLVHDVSILFRMPLIKVVKCEHNAIRHFEATLGEKMRILEVGQNPMTKVSLDAFSASDLTSLNLSSTNMARLDEGLFRLLPSLTELILDRNQFVTLPESLGELANLQVFSCNNNNLATLPDSIGNLRKLIRLNIQNNNLKRLPASIWNCASLIRVNVTSNLLEALPLPPPASRPSTATPITGSFSSNPIDAAAEAVSGGTDKEREGSVGSLHFPPTHPGVSSIEESRPLAKSLRQLRVADNHLADDVFTILQLFTDLEVLNLSFNEIYEVPPNTLCKHKRLKELYLSGNGLACVPEDLFELRELRVLFLNGNKLQTLPAELGQMSALVELDVGNNNLKYNIANWTYDWNWNNNPELRYLNLSGNQRFEIKSKILTLNGRRKNISDFGDLRSLRVLGLMDVTVAAKSTPDELINRRVRTSLSKVNDMSYGIADALGDRDELSLVDVVVPMFRKVESEALLAMFDGRGHTSCGGSKIARFLTEGIAVQLDKQLALMGPSGSDGPTVEDCLRRTFLQLNSMFPEMIIDEHNRRKSDARAVDAMDRPLPIKRFDLANTPEWSEGCSAIVAYIVDHTLYIANAGDALAVLSHNGGQAELIATKHEPFSRLETQRIRTAEGWVSLDGRVNDKLDVSRGFGYYNLFPVVNAAPAVHKVNLSDSHEFIIIANRSLWEFLSYQTAVDIARMERDEPMIAAQRLRDLAISYGGDESIMVMILSVADLFGNRGVNPLAADVMRRQRFGMGASLPADRTLARLEREIPPPIGQIALVFTDIKNSTHLWETNSGMHTAMRIHNTLLRRQLRTVAGFESKVEGDGMMASFSCVSAALLWCFNVQIGLLHEDWPQELLESEDGREVRDENGNVIYRGLRLRMGIHWGSPVCEPDPITGRMDYFGPMVNRASRIASAADGGQICVSKDVVNELTETIGAFDSSNQIRVMDDEDDVLLAHASRDVVLLRRMGFGITEIGFHRLKGLETPELLHLVYPRPLIGRLEHDRTLQTEAHPARVFEPTVQLLDSHQVRKIGLLCLRVEALSAGRPFPGIMATHGEQARMRHVEDTVTDKPELLVCMIHDDASDEELALVLLQLTVRLANAVAKMTLDVVVRNMPRLIEPPEPTAWNVGPNTATSDTVRELNDKNGPLGEGPVQPQPDALGLSLGELQRLVKHLQSLTQLP